MTEAAPVKKGKRSFKPADRLTIHNKDKNFRYRFCNDDPMNVQRRLAEGWQFVNAATGIPGEHVKPGYTGDGNPLDSAMTYRDMVVMALPEEIGKERDAWVAERTDRQEQDIVRTMRQDANAAGGSATPKLVIE